jgi:DNA-binding IclR family transcriptional regulator
MSKTERALLVLERITSGQQRPTHADLVRELGMQRSTLSDVLAELRTLRLIELQGRQYVPGLRLVSLVNQGSRIDLGDSVRASLARLSAATGETAVWVVDRVGSDEVVAIAQVQSAHAIRFVADIGVPWSIWTTAAGHAFLAFSSRAAPAEMGERLAEIRSAGYVVVSSDTGGIAVAAPVIDPRTGIVLGAFSVVGPNDRLSDPHRQVWPALAKEIQILASPSVANDT